MESLTRGGVETVLFVEPPTDEQLERYPNAQAIGIAGNSRTMSPAEMQQALPPAFDALLRHRPNIVHYKTCSTFDSSPETGNIGRAIEIGMQRFGNQICPLVVGAPALQRFCVFGNLFARSGLDSAPFRLDRHPTMKCHPVTPMDEADLRVHLGKQTQLPVQLIDVLTLDAEFNWRKSIGDFHGITLFDTLRDEHLASIGLAIDELQQREAKPLFTAGSSGVGYALVEQWRRTRKISGSTVERPGKSVAQTLIVSGSCSPVTERQIQHAIARGFAEVAVDTPAVGAGEQAATEAAAERALHYLSEKRSVIVHTARGTGDARMQQNLATPQQLGDTLAHVLRPALQTRSLQRVAVTGGDTSGHVARRIGIEALEMIGPLAPGAPLCRARSQANWLDGIEITFKGGQVGHDDFFEVVLNGGPI